MNQVFQFRRWSLLVGKHWEEHKKKYLLSIAAYIGLLSLWFIFMLLVNETNPLAEDLQQIAFFFSLFLVGPFYASQFYSDLSSRPRGINYLLTPASTLEKLLCGLLFAVLIFPIVLTLSYYLVDSIFVSVANVAHPAYTEPGNDGILEKAAVVNVFDIAPKAKENVPLYMMMLFLAVQSFFLLGSVYFAKYSYVRTAITGCILFILFIYMGEQLPDLLPTKGVVGNGFTNYKIYEEGRIKLVQLSPGLESLIQGVLLFGFTPIIWLATYFRLKEKEL